MNRPAARTTPPAGPTPAGAPVAGLDFDEIEDTVPSTPYPRGRGVARLFHAARSWVRGVFGHSARR